MSGKKLILTDDFFAENVKDIERILRRAVRHALKLHKALGNPIAVWEDGKVVMVPADEIIIPTELESPQ
jgi:hypothetical protein